MQTVSNTSNRQDGAALAAIRDALRKYQKREDVSLNEHARRLGVSAAYLSDFLNGHHGLGSTMLLAIRSLHPDMLTLLLRWMEGGTEAGPVASARRP